MKKKQNNIRVFHDSMVSFRMPTALCDAMKELASSKNQTLTDFITALVKRELKREGISIVVTQELV